MVEVARQNNFKLKIYLRETKVFNNEETSMQIISG